MCPHLSAAIAEVWVGVQDSQQDLWDAAAAAAIVGTLGTDAHAPHLTLALLPNGVLMLLSPCRYKLIGRQDC